MTFNKIPLALGFNSSTGNASGLVEFTLDLSNVGGVCDTPPTPNQSLVFNGSDWCPSTIVTGGGGGGGGAVNSVNDLTGSVSLYFSSLSGTAIDSPSNNEVLVYQSDKWINQTVAEAGLATAANLTTTTNTANAAMPKAGGAFVGAVTTNSTFDGVDIATRDGVLTTTTNTANAALPKVGGVDKNSLVITNSASAVSSLSGASGSIVYFEGTNPAPALQPITTILQNAAVRVEDKNLGDLANVSITDTPTTGDQIEYRGGLWQLVSQEEGLEVIDFAGQLVSAVSGSYTVSNVVTVPPGFTGKGDTTVDSFIIFSGTDASSTEYVGTRWGANWVEGPQNIATTDGNYFAYVSATSADAGSSGVAAIELASGVLDFIGTGYSAIDLSSLGDTNFTNVTQHQHIQWDGTQWINAFEDEQYLRIRNETGSTLTKGQLVYVSGSHNANITLVSLAKADSATTMPSLGAVSENIANNANGTAVTFGRASGLNTSAFNEGDTVYVSPTTAGEITNTRPTGASELVQNVGVVTKSHATAGVIKVTGVGRANDVPNSATFTGSLNVSGASTFAGGATFNSTAPQSTVTPAASNDLTTKTYVDTVDATIIAGSVLKAIPVTISAKHTATGGISFTTVAPSSTVTPATNNDLTNKAYVDSVAGAPKTFLAIGTSTASIANLTVDLTWNTPEISDSDITLSSNELTFAVAGTYSIDLSARTTGNNRVELFLRTFKDTGSGYAELTDHTAANYMSRDTDQNTGSVVLSTMFTLAAGDKLKFQCTGNTDGDGTLTTAGTILKILGWT